MQPTHKIIGHTQERYNEIVFNLLFKWADLYSQGCNNKMQQIFANTQINNWFHTEYKKLLKQFKNDLKEAEKHYQTTARDRCKMYIETVTKIYDIYPSALLETIKTTKNTIIKKETFNHN